MSEPLPPDGFDSIGEIEFASAQEGGAYAEAVALWHTPFALVLEFLAPTRPPQESSADPARLPPERIVSRVRLPIGLAFDLIRGVSAIMTGYEAEWGEIRRPEPRPRGAP